MSELSRTFPNAARWFAFPGAGACRVGSAGLALAGFVVLVAYPNLPSMRRSPRTSQRSLGVYTSDGVLIGEFGERRSLVSTRRSPT
jgi:hypothetical protein